MRKLIITADDYGYSARYDEGILEASTAGAVDSVSAMVMRPSLDPEPLLATGVEVGLHLELAAGHTASRANAAERAAAGAAIEEQVERFGELFGRPPAHLDGHHHCHARAGLGVVVADAARALAAPVRSIGGRQRRLLRCRGVATPDHLIGRCGEGEPALPPELAEGRLGEGVTEWMVHPGRPDPASGSRYDRGRQEDLELLLSWRPPQGVRRASHRAALAVAAARAGGPARGPEC